MLWPPPQAKAYNVALPTRVFPFSDPRSKKADLEECNLFCNLRNFTYCKDLLSPVVWYCQGVRLTADKDNTNRLDNSRVWQSPGYEGYLQEMQHQSSYRKRNSSCVQLIIYYKFMPNLICDKTELFCSWDEYQCIQKEIGLYCATQEIFSFF